MSDSNNPLIRSKDRGIVCQKCGTVCDACVSVPLPVYETLDDIEKAASDKIANVLLCGDCVQANEDVFPICIFQGEIIFRLYLRSGRA